jgi:pyridoxamine 5'-phosphate oxidase
MGAPERLQALPEIEAALWRELSRAVHDRHHAWRLATLATVATVPDGLPPDDVQAEARTVVLRDCDAASRCLLVYTDARSAKAQQAQARPHGVLVLWSPALGWQLRLNVVLVLHTSGLQVSSRWAQLKLTPSAQDYLSPLPPGAPLAGAPTVAPVRESRDHFSVLECRVQSTDWLELHRDGHRRARFDAEGACWLVP